MFEPMSRNEAPRPTLEDLETAADAAAVDYFEYLTKWANAQKRGA